MSKDKKGSWLPWVLGAVAITYLIEKHRGLKIFVSFIGLLLSLWFAIWIFSNVFGANPPQYFRGGWSNEEYAFDNESADAFMHIGYTKIKLYNNSDALWGKKVKWKYDGNTDTISFTYKDKYNFKITPISFNGDVYLDDGKGRKESFADVLRVEINGAVLFFTPTVRNDAKALNDGQKLGKYPKPKNIFREIDAGNIIKSVNPNTKEEVTSLPNNNNKFVASSNLSESLRSLMSPLFGDVEGAADKDIEEQQYVRKFVISYNSFAKYKIDRVDWIGDYKAILDINGKEFEIAGYDYGCRIDCTILNGLATVNDYKIILMDLSKTLDSTITDGMFNTAFETAKNWRIGPEQTTQPYRLINDNVGILMFYYDATTTTHEPNSYEVSMDNILANDSSMQFLKEQQ